MAKISQKILKFLNENKIKYEIVSHKTVYTAYDKAATLKIKPNVIGKTLVLKTDNEIAMLLISGNKNLDKVKFQKVLNAHKKKQGDKFVKKVDFISEKVMKNKFKGIKLGAVPPFGKLWKLPIFIDRGLLKEKNIFVNAGIYEASFKLSPRNFKKLDGIFNNFSKAKK